MSKNPLLASLFPAVAQSKNVELAELGDRLAAIIACIQYLQPRLNGDLKDEKCSYCDGHRYRNVDDGHPANGCPSFRASLNMYVFEISRIAKALIELQEAYSRDFHVAY